MMIAHTRVGGGSGTRDGKTADGPSAKAIVEDKENTQCAGPSCTEETGDLMVDA